MIVKEYEYIRGNTAAQPRRSSEPDRKRYEELQKQKEKEREENLKRKDVREKVHVK